MLSVYYPARTCVRVCAVCWICVEHLHMSMLVCVQTWRPEQGSVIVTVTVHLVLCSWI